MLRPHEPDPVSTGVGMGVLSSYHLESSPTSAAPGLN